MNFWGKHEMVMSPSVQVQYHFQLSQDYQVIAVGQLYHR